MRIEGAGAVRVVGSRFANNALSGFVQIGRSLRCLDTEFADNGLADADAANLVVNRVSGHIANNQLNGGVGIRVAKSDNLVIEGNLLNRHRIGLLSFDSRPRIQNNHLIANELTLRIEGTSVPVRISLNSVQDSDRLLDNRAVSEVNAANNWVGLRG